MYRTDWWSTTDVDGTGPAAMEARVQHGRRTTPAPPHALDRRVGSITRGDSRGQDAGSASRRRAGDQLLRGGPGWVLDPPLSHEPGDQESSRGLLEHRSEST